MFNSEIVPREALAAPTDKFAIHYQSVVIMIVSIMSVLGAGWIMASFCVRLTHGVDLPRYVANYFRSFRTSGVIATSSSSA